MMRGHSLFFLRRQKDCDPLIEAALTDVGVLEQSADAGFSLQLLMVYKTVTPGSYNHVSDWEKQMKMQLGAGLVEVNLQIDSFRE